MHSELYKGSVDAVSVFIVVLPQRYDVCTVS